MIPKKWDLRSLTDYKKRIIRKREKEYPEVIKHPYKFQGRKYSKDKAKALLNAGYSGVGQHILIPNRGNSTTSTRVLRDKIVIDRGDRIETVYLSSGPNFLKNLYKRIDAPLPRGSFWALKVGDNNTFLNNYTKTLSQLMRYGDIIKKKSVRNIHGLLF